MSLSGLGISCEPVKDSLEVCEHSIHINLPCQLCKLQKQIIALTDMYKSLSCSVAGFQDHKIRQIDENRKISKRMDELGTKFEYFMQNSSFNLNISVNEPMPGELKPMVNKVPHKCPVCNGYGGTIISGTIDEYCHACEGKGIVWG